MIGPLPEPLTGQSLGCQLLVEELTKRHRVDVINLSKNGLKNGLDSVGRILQVFKILVSVWRRHSDADIVYLTVSESIAGNVKDLLIYLLCLPKLKQTVIHLYGGAGIRGILMSGRHPLRKPNEWFLRRLGGVVVEGQRQASMFSSSVAAHRLHVVPNFAEDYLFSDADGIRDKFARTQPLRILFLSNLLRGKGHEELLSAFESLSDSERESVQLDIAGQFQSESSKRSFLQRIERCEGVRYHGPVRGQRKKELFHQAHIFCLPTYYAYEGQPFSIIEAYASGCVVITTNHSGIGDVFTDVINGYEVEKRSAGSLKGAIQRALQDPVALERIANWNLAVAREKYRSTTHNSKLVEILDAVSRRSGDSGYTTES